MLNEWFHVLRGVTMSAGIVTVAAGMVRSHWQDMALLSLAGSIGIMISVLIREGDDDE